MEYMSGPSSLCFTCTIGVSIFRGLLKGDIRSLDYSSPDFVQCLSLSAEDSNTGPALHQVFVPCWESQASIVLARGFLTLVNIRRESGFVFASTGRLAAVVIFTSACKASSPSGSCVGLSPGPRESRSHRPGSNFTGLGLGGSKPLSGLCRGFSGSMRV